MPCCPRSAARRAESGRGAGGTGVLDKYGVELIGANLRAMQVAEDRELFKDAMTPAGLESPRSGVAQIWLKRRRIAQEELGRYPIFIRPSFTLGGSGAGTVFTPQEFDEKVDWGLRESPVHTVLIEESLIGWKEYELEVMRDKAPIILSSFVRSRIWTQWACTPATASPWPRRRR